MLLERARLLQREAFLQLLGPQPARLTSVTLPSGNPPRLLLCDPLLVPLVPAVLGPKVAKRWPGLTWRSQAGRDVQQP